MRGVTDDSIAATVEEIWRYPVKGLGGEKLLRARLSENRGIPFDRRWLLQVAADRSRERWQPWCDGLSLKQNAHLVHLRASVDNDGALTVAAAGEQITVSPNRTPDLARAEEFLRDFLCERRLRLVDCESRPVWDYPNVHATILNRASVDDLAAAIGVPLSPTRFRANIMYSAPPWGEINSPPKKLRIGAAELKLGGGVDRCRATTVNPDTGERDIDIPRWLICARGRNEMGLKATVIGAGDIAPGMEMRF